MESIGIMLKKVHNFSPKTHQKRLSLVVSSVFSFPNLLYVEVNCTGNLSKDGSTWRSWKRASLLRGLMFMIYAYFTCISCEFT